MQPMPVHAWPGALPPAADGVVVIAIDTQGLQRPQAREAIRQAVREALCALLGRPLAGIAIQSTPGQSPRIIVAGMPAAEIGCSFTHEEGCSLAALNLHGQVGVDVMREQDIPDWQQVARDYLGPAVTAALSGTEAAQRPRAFALSWTAREARLKFHGKQLGEWPADSEASALTSCIIKPLALPAGLAGAIALPG